MFRMMLLCAAIALSACVAPPNLQRYGSIDEASKTVTVPPGSEGLKGKLKQALANDGWKLVVGRGPSVTEGQVGATTMLERYDTFNSRYQLVVASRQYDRCLEGSPAIIYDVSLIDNSSSSEVFTLGGKGCESHALEKFVSALHGK